MNGLHTHANLPKKGTRDGDFDRMSEDVRFFPLHATAAVGTANIPRPTAARHKTIDA